MDTPAAIANLLTLSRNYYGIAPRQNCIFKKIVLQKLFEIDTESKLHRFPQVLYLLFDAIL